MSKHSFTRRTALLAIAASATAGSPLAFAQAYPNKPVRIIIGLAPGGMNDIVGRTLSDRLGERLGQPVIVENRTGAGGTLGAAYAAKSPADGYTIFLGAISNMAIAVTQFKNLPYNPLTDFAPVTQLAASSNILVAAPGSNYKTLADVIAAAKKEPGGVLYATAGQATSGHMAGELFNLMAGVKLKDVPYKGDGPALTDVAGGQVALGFAALPAAMTLIKAGRLRPIAVSSRVRSPMLPDTPTIHESGVAGYDMSPWVGLFAPAGTPRDIIERVRNEVVQVMKQQPVRDRFNDLGLVAVGDTPAEFGSFLKVEIDKWVSVSKAAGIVPE